MWDFKAAISQWAIACAKTSVAVVAFAAVSYAGSGCGVHAQTTHASALSDIIWQRRVAALSDAISRPFPNPDCDATSSRIQGCVWAKLKLASAELYLGRSSA